MIHIYSNENENKSSNIAYKAALHDIFTYMEAVEEKSGHLSDTSQSIDSSIIRQMIASKTLSTELPYREVQLQPITTTLCASGRMVEIV